MQATNDLSRDEKRRRDFLESVVERGLANWIEVGKALLEIRESKLYRDECKTFEEYVTLRFKITRQRAYQLIDGVEVVGEIETSSALDIQNLQENTNNLQTEVPSNRAIAELSMAPKEDRQKIYNAAKNGNGKPPTAPQVRRARISVVNSSDTESDDEIQDEVGNIVPKNLREVFKSREQFDKLLNDLRSINTTLNPLAGNPQNNQKPLPGFEFFARERQEFVRRIDQCRAELKHNRPYAICPCPHKSGVKCSACSGLNYVTKSVYDKAPKDLKRQG